MTIIAILFVMFNNRWSQSAQLQQRAACLVNLQQIGVALRIYAQENRGWFPMVPGAITSETPLSLLVPRDTSVTGIFICPGANDKRLPEAEPFTSRKISYAYAMGLRTSDLADRMLMADRLVALAARKTGDPLFSLNGKPPGTNHGQFGGNILLLDGSAIESGPIAEQNWPLNPNVTLVNPKP